MRPQEIIPFPDYPILGYRMKEDRSTPFTRMARREEGHGQDDDPVRLSDGYVAGLRSADGEETWIKFPLPAEAVECAVLNGAGLSVMLSPCGRLAFDAEGLSDEALEMAGAEEPFRSLTLETLVRTCLDPMLLNGEDDLPKDLDTLRDQLQRALHLVDETRNRLSGTQQS
jgi:hypothetical protein